MGGNIELNYYLRDFRPVVLSPANDGSPCKELIPDPDPFPGGFPF